MHKSILEELEKADKFIFLEYFIIEEGMFWNSILEILKRKVSEGVEVKVVYDDIGCMNTLPGNYFKQLRKQGIEAAKLGKLKAEEAGNTALAAKYQSYISESEVLIRDTEAEIKELETVKIKEAEKSLDQSEKALEIYNKQKTILDSQSNLFGNILSGITGLVTPLIMV
jgi:hypothetical protein